MRLVNNKQSKDDAVVVPNEVADALEKAGYSFAAEEFRAPLIVSGTRIPRDYTKTGGLTDPLFSGDDVPEDLQWLWSFEHEGELLSTVEIELVLNILIQGKAGKFGNQYAGRRMTPRVLAAVAHATKECRVKYHVNVTSVIRELSTILSSNLSDFIDITEHGVRLKNTTGLDKAKFGAIQEIVETVTPHGRQVRIKMYDKMSAISLAAKLLDMTPPERKEISISGLEDRLNSALARKEAYRAVIEGELVEDEDDGESED